MATPLSFRKKFSAVLSAINIEDKFPEIEAISLPLINLDPSEINCEIINEGSIFRNTFAAISNPANIPISSETIVPIPVALESIIYSDVASPEI